MVHQASIGEKWVSRYSKNLPGLENNQLVLDQRHCMSEKISSRSPHNSIIIFWDLQHQYQIWTFTFIVWNSCDVWCGPFILVLGENETFPARYHHDAIFWLWWDHITGSDQILIRPAIFNQIFWAHLWLPPRQNVNPVSNSWTVNCKYFLSKNFSRQSTSLV